MRGTRLIISAAITTSIAVVSIDTLGAVQLGLPNPTRTPGATNPAVTPRTLASTICVSGYTKTIRPPSSYTTALKRSQLATGYAVGNDRSTRDYEEDHLIPLEVGGNPTSVKNLWPEPRFGTWNASRKDALENAVHRAVCAHQISLATGQAVFAHNWIAAYPTYVH
jgi:hypothetical protein